MANGEVWTIQKLLGWMTGYFTEKGIDSPRLSTEMLLSYVLGLKRIELYTNFSQPVAKPQLDKLRELVKRAGENEPIAYLTGRSEFYSLEMTVTRDCLIPRPETELLVERSVELLRKRSGKQLVCDLCTGCGCIAVAIAKNFLDAQIVATDISDEALKIALQNAQKHKVDERISFLLGDLFEPIIPELDKYKFDLVVCNPPYVTSGEYETLEPNVKNFEPPQALLGGRDGLDVYRKICEQVEKFLKPDAALVLEIGYSQGNSVKELLDETALFSEISLEKDFQNNDRIVTASKKM
ncbi:MAG: peptide chain release factor N(5)-glutamine methyltransferase [Phycisphaerae bacterium]|jgi:release factor glutamine methyltransferase